MSHDLTKEAAEEILGLPRRYSREDLRSAFADIAQLYHPDVVARHRFDKEEAQRNMVEANRAYTLLKRQFASDSERVIIRDGTAAVEYDGMRQREDVAASPRWEKGFRDFVYEWDGGRSVEEEVPSPSIRSVLLGPIVGRAICIVVLALLWWRFFPLLPQNLASYPSFKLWDFVDASLFVGGFIYPTYFLVYEICSGYLSEFARELLNEIVSWLSGHYVDLSPRTATEGCAACRLIREQAYALLLIPVLVFMFAMTLEVSAPVLKLVLALLTIALALDTLAACVHNGYVNTWATLASERVEVLYLRAHRLLLKRCGAWKE